MDKKKIEKLSVSVLTDITEAISKTDDAVLGLTLANITAKIAIIYVEVNKSPWVSVKDELPPCDINDKSINLNK